MSEIRLSTREVFAEIGYTEEHIPTKILEVKRDNLQMIDYDWCNSIYDRIDNSEFWSRRSRTPGVFRVTNINTDFNLMFSHESKEIGKLWIENDRLKFSGDLDKSAEKFFTIMQQICDKYIEEKLTKRYSE